MKNLRTTICPQPMILKYIVVGVLCLMSSSCPLMSALLLSPFLKFRFYAEIQKVLHYKGQRETKTHADSKRK